MCRQVLCYARVMFQTTSCKSNTKFPIKRVYFGGVWGLTTSSYAVYHYTTGGHKDL